MKKGASVVIVEDDLLSAEYLKEILKKEGYGIVDIVESGEKAVEVCTSSKPDIILMDIMLRGKMSGCEAALEINHRLPSSKIIFLTAYADTEMIDYAVRSKAYAYLMKPYREKEIVATLQMVLEHGASEENKTTIEDEIELSKGFRFNFLKRKLLKGEREIPLSEKKLKLIELLAKNRNGIVSKKQLCLTIWNEVKSDNTLRSLIHRFRNAIGEDIIDNINGIGYTIKSE